MLLVALLNVKYVFQLSESLLSIWLLYINYFFYRRTTLMNILGIRIIAFGKNILGKQQTIIF